jgi:hypothetical protein
VLANLMSQRMVALDALDAGVQRRCNDKVEETPP